MLFGRWVPAVSSSIEELFTTARRNDLARESLVNFFSAEVVSSGVVSDNGLSTSFVELFSRLLFWDSTSLEI